MSNPHLVAQRFFQHGLSFGLMSCILFSCSKEEPGHEVAAETVLQVSDDGKQEPVKEEMLQEEASQETSLRDRVTTTPAPEGSKPMWSTAVTPEERKENLEKALAAGESPYVIDLHDLGGWDLDERLDNPIPKYIQDLDGKEFIMRGFMMPDIDFEHIRSFHLVRSLFSCCFGAPPQINEILRVTLADKDGMDYTYNTIEVRGRLTVKFEVVDGLVEDIFRLENVTYHILEFDDPNAPDSFDAKTGFDSVIPSGAQEY